MSMSESSETDSRHLDSDPELKNATLVRRVAGFVIYKSYDEDGHLLGETSLPMKPMFSDEDLIEAGFLKPA